MKKQKNQAFTLMEMMIVVILASIITGTAMVNYHIVIARAHEKDVYMQLNSMRTAMEIYKERTGGYVPSNLANAAAINSALGLNITENEVTFSCNSNVGAYDCQGVRTDGLWSMHSTDSAFDGAPHCLSGACPTCVTASPCSLGF